MAGSITRVCTICGDDLADKPHPFAVVQSVTEDKIRVFHWRSLPTTDRVRGACSVLHVRELVIHWMVTEHLDYPFANPGIVDIRNAQGKSSEQTLVDYSLFAKAIGELTVDHESARKILVANPNWLGVILNELEEALYRSIEDKVTCESREEQSTAEIHRL